METFRPFGKTVQVKDGMVSLNQRNFISFFRKVISLYGFYLKRRNIEPSSIEHLISRLFHLYKENGINYLISYMKTSLAALNCFIGKIPLKSTKSFGIRVKLSKGLPVLLPPLWRREIRKGNLAIIRLCASILNVYKALAGNYGEPDISSILTPLDQTLNYDDWELFCKEYFSKDYNKIRSPLDDFLNMEPPLITTAGPNNSISLLGFKKDCQALQEHGLWDHIIRYARDTGFAERGFNNAIAEYLIFMKPVKETIARLSPEGRFKNHFEKRSFSTIVESSKYLVGKLALKFEAAGKIRVFAIGDYYTQWVLTPLHKCIFAWLKQIHSDATFSQNETLNEFARHNRNRRFWSFDLKSATDLIPRPLYVIALSYSFLDPDTAKLWEQILDRTFAVPSELKGKFPLGIRYGTGQPMGFLSSWACLALVHHLLVRFSWFRATGSYNIPNHKYLVLGDDLVISDPKLAMAYIEVTKLFNIPLSRYKSYESATIINFASQTIDNQGNNISPISLKEILQCDSLSKKLEFGNRLVRMGYIDSGLSNLFRVFFTPDLWKSETPYLSAGLLSPFGRRVYRCLCQPDGRTNLLSTYLSAFENRLSVFNPPKVEDREEYLTGVPIPDDKTPHYTYALRQLTKLCEIKVDEWCLKTTKFLAELDNKKLALGAGPDYFSTNSGPLFDRGEWKYLPHVDFSLDNYGDLNYRRVRGDQTANRWYTSFRIPAGVDPVWVRIRQVVFLVTRSGYLSVLNRRNTAGDISERGDSKFSPLQYITDIVNLANSLSPLPEVSSIENFEAWIKSAKKATYQWSPRENVSTNMILAVIKSVNQPSTWYSPPRMRRFNPRRIPARGQARISRNKSQSDK
jgi:hypothetical protein